MNKFSRTEMRVLAASYLYANPFTTPSEAKLSLMILQLINEIENQEPEQSADTLPHEKGLTDET